jgi:hypothetical protein
MLRLCVDRARLLEDANVSEKKEAEVRMEHLGLQAIRAHQVPLVLMDWRGRKETEVIEDWTALEALKATGEEWECQAFQGSTAFRDCLDRLDQEVFLA